MAVSPADVATTLGRPTPTGTQFNQWQMWIEDARRLIGGRLGDLNLLDQDNLDYVVREAVAERVRHTRDDASISKTVKVDDGEVTTRFPEGQATSIVITDAWWELLDPIGESGAFTILPYSFPRGRC